MGEQKMGEQKMGEQKMGEQKMGEQKPNCKLSKNGQKWTETRMIRGVANSKSSWWYKCITAILDAFLSFAKNKSIRSSNPNWKY